MSDHRKKDGFTKIENRLLEALGKTRLSAYESQVLHVIIRKTDGFHKLEDWIPRSQIARATGIIETNVTRTIKSLIRRNIIRKNGNKLGIQRDFSQWKGVSKEIPQGGVSKEILKGISRAKNLGIYSDTLKRNSKETNQKKGDFSTMNFKKKETEEEGPELYRASIDQVRSEKEKRARKKANIRGIQMAQEVLKEGKRRRKPRKE